MGTEVVHFLSPLFSGWAFPCTARASLGMQGAEDLTKYRFTRASSIVIEKVWGSNIRLPPNESYLISQANIYISRDGIIMMSVV